MTPVTVGAAIVFALTYLVLGLGGLPRLRIDRAGATIVGATLMVAIGAIPAADAVRSIDLGTIALLFGMMIVAAYLRIAGFFGWTARRVLGLTRSPVWLLVLTVFLSGVLSALFVNDSVCVLLTPLVVELTAAATLPVVPFLLAVAMGSNAGSVATIVGNPQNMLIANTGGISYARFAAALTPVALGALVIVAALLVWRYRARLQGAVDALPAPAPVDRGLLTKTLVVSALLLAALLAGVAPPLAALGAASVLLITRRVDPARVYALVDWPLLLLFAGLFVVVEAVQRTGLAGQLLAVLSQAFSGPFSTVAVVTALSNLVSNVPAVILLSHATVQAPDPEHARLVLAMASTLAGNLTLVGSVANLVVVSQAGPHARVGFWEYARIGAPITLLSLAWGVAWLR